VKSVRQSEFDSSVRQASDRELLDKLNRERKALYEGRQEIARKQLSNPHTIGVARRNVARVLTEIRARELKAGKGS